MIQKILLINTILLNSLFAQNNEYLFGFATSNTFTYCDIKDSSFLNSVIKMSPNILRFPGGAVGNFYHFKGSGYGFDFKEINQYHGGKFPKRSIGLDKSRAKKGHNHNYIEDFIVFAQKTNSKAVLVANLFVDNDDIILMIERLLQEKIDIVGIELGSELSNRSYFTKGYTIDNYIVAAKKCNDKIKARFPDIPTSIVAAPLGKPPGHRHNIWNNKLAKLDFYDAIIIHSYAKVVAGKDEYGQMVEEKYEYNNKEDNFTLYKERALNFLKDEFPNEIRKYNKIFNKPIWITEWNLQMSKTTGNTTLQSLFVANYLLDLLTNKTYNNINLTTYHNLGGRDYSGSIFMSKGEEVEKRNTFHVFTMLAELFDEVKELEIKKVEKNDLFEYSIHINNKLKYIYYVNWSSKKSSVLYEINDFAYVSLFGQSLYDTDLVILKETHNRRDKASYLEIKPYSITLISALDHE